MKNKAKEFLKKLWEKICDFVDDHPTISVIVMDIGIFGAYIGGLLLWAKHAAKKPKYWQRELEFCEQNIQEFTKAKNYALEMIEKLSK